MSDPSKPIPCGKCDALDCRDHAYCGLFGPNLGALWVDREVLFLAHPPPVRERSAAQYWQDVALADAFNKAKHRPVDAKEAP